MDAEITRLSPRLVATINQHLQGARLAKFRASVHVINASLAQGGWTPRGSVKATAGFYQGLYSRMAEEHPTFQLMMCLRYGRSITPAMLNEFAAKLTDVELAWVKLCIEKDAAIKQLCEARPLPKITAIGLSPKVTKTFQECDLDIDIATIKMAKVERRTAEVQDRDKETQQPLFDTSGKPVMTTLVWYEVIWTPGILFNKSRFAHSDCQACGKTIPSRRYVPVEATCRKNGLVALWVGCDCAKNIFGIQDVGVSKETV